MTRIIDHLQEALDEARARHGVVGASLAVRHGGRVETAASGVLNKETGQAATPGSSFQIGSITKVFTAALVMRLVDDGRLDLDRPVRDWLPDLSDVDPGAVDGITLRRLLTHTSGLEDAGTPEGLTETATLAEFIAKALNPPRLIAPPGTIHSYSNTGFALAGRVTEAVAGRAWTDELMERICAPLGLASAFVDPADAVRFEAAVGHMPGPDGPAGDIVTKPEPIAMAPAGATFAMSAADLLAFVSRQSEILSPKAIAEMQAAQFALAPYAPRATTHWGLGWALVDYPRHFILSHDGATPGQAAYLRVLPDAGVAVALLTNSLSIALWDELWPKLLRELAGVEIAHPPAQRGLEVDPARYVGAYGAAPGGVEITRDGDELRLAAINPATGEPIIEAELIPYAPDVFSLRSAQFPTGLGEASFVGRDAAGRPEFLSWGFRALPRRTEERAP